MKVVVKTLEKDPANRYQSARELGDDLARITAGMPPLARLRRRWISPLTAAGVVVALLVAATGGHLWRASGKDSTKGNATEAKPSAAEATAVEPTSIVVLSFVNMSPGRLVYLVQEAGWVPLPASFLAVASVVIMLAGWNAREITVSRRRRWATATAIVVVAALASIR